jgi:glycosyltransferase involved in cell wall biosynthesis
MNSGLRQETFSILFIVPSDYASLVEKGVAPMILERDEGGFFKKVFNVHPYASRTQSLDLNETQRLIEYGPDYPLRFLTSKFGRAINYLLKPAFIIKSVTHIIKREHIDVIRATDPFWCGFYAWAASKLAGIPFCISIHADYDKYYQLNGRKRGTPLLFEMLERFVLPRTPLVMPIREYLIQGAVKRGADPTRIRVIPHGISIPDFTPEDIRDTRNNFGIPPTKKVVSFVGRLAKDNYVYDVIELARRVSKIRDDFVVVLAGDGGERKKLETLIHEYNLSSAVVFTGFLPKDRVMTLRRQSSLALCLMGGFSLIEACMVGCPVISYDVEWHYELVKNGETGFLINENDLEALTKTVIYLLDRPKEALEMGARARELAMARHDISYTSEVKKNCYRELLQHRAYGSC